MSEEIQYDIPVVMIVFRRLDTVKILLEKISKYKPIKLYVVADAAREGRPDEKEKCDAVREYIKNSINWNCEFHPVFAQKNKGCAKNICEGLNEVFQNEKYAIVFEDDGIPNDEFFLYAQYLLKKYEHDERIEYIAGFNGIGDNDVIKDSYCFGKTAPMSGAIATWADRWLNIDFSLANWPEDRKNGTLRKYFYTSEMYHVIEKAMDDAMNIVHITGGWDYQFNYDLFRKDRFAIVPKINLASNVGYDQDALHIQDTKEAIRLRKLMDYSQEIFTFPMKEPAEIVHNQDYDKLRQKKMLEVRGNYLERHLYYFGRAAKETCYKVLPKGLWNGLKKLFK